MNNEYYTTSDLGLAASLTASGYPVVNIDKSNSRRVVFYFADSSSVRNAVNAYWSSDLLISGMVLMEHIKQLKTRIYS